MTTEVYANDLKDSRGFEYGVNFGDVVHVHHLRAAQLALYFLFILLDGDDYTAS